MSNKALLIQSGDGTAIPAGMVGESWIDTSATSLTTSPTTVVSRSLPKGKYIASGMVTARGGTVNTAENNVSAAIVVGGVTIGNTAKAICSPGWYGTATIGMVPFSVTVDNTLVELKGTMDSTFLVSGGNMLCIIRIAGG